MINQTHYNREEIEKWISFRDSLFSLFANRNKVVMNIIDSLSSNYQGANTAVQLSENDLFNYNYNSLYKGINSSFSPNPKTRKQQIKLKQELIVSTLNIEEQLPFNLFALDATNMDRSYAPTLIDREFVHKPSSIFGQKPITLGHKYSVLTYLTNDKKTQHNWSIPFSTERISSCSTLSETAKKQIKTLFKNCPELNQDKLSIIIIVINIF
jgi:hypothetical protein